MFGLVLVLLWALAATAAASEPLHQGRRLYEQGDFEGAITALEAAVAAEPESAEAHDWLGRAYGRRAQQASWLDAMALARRSRESFEAAVRLDPQYVPALMDLIRFYQRAPRLLGGGSEKAEPLLRRLEQIDPAAAQALRPAETD